MKGEAISHSPSTMATASSHRCRATYSSWPTPKTSMPTTNAFRIMWLRSASTISRPACMGNHGETRISTPSSMPNQSSHGRCVLKKRKSDMVDLPLKRGIRQRRAITTLRYQTTIRPHRGRMSWTKRRQTVAACKARRLRFCGLLRDAELLQPIACLAQAGTDLQRLFEIGNCAGLVAKPHLRPGAIVPGIGVGRIVLQRLVVVGEAAFVVALVQPDHSAIAPAAGVGWRDPGRLAIVGGGAIELLGITVDIAAGDIGERVRPERDLHAVVGQRMGGVALALIGVAAVAIGDGERRIVFDCPA